MRAALAVCRHELRLLLYAALSYVFMAGFLVALASAIFLIADFYSSDEASIQLMLSFAPWVSIVLVPALAMGMWPNDQVDKSAELTLTLPLSLPAIVIGKFLAGYLVLLATLAFTFPFPLTVAFLGEPDFAQMAAGYLAVASMLGLFFAVSLFAAAAVRNRVGGFVIGLGLLFVLMMMGWDVFTNFLKASVSPTLLDVISYFSPRTWILRMGEGMIEIAGVVYFAAGIGVVLVGCGMVIGWRDTHARAFRPMVLSACLASICALASVVPLAKFPLALDWTAEREFTLDAGTRNILRNLPEGVTATFYWSAGEATVPVTIKSHARRIRNLLDNMALNSRGRLRIAEIDPQPDSDEELQAVANGVRRIPMSSGDQFYLGLTVAYGKRVGNIPYFDLARDRFLEYDIALALNGLARTATPKIGVISPLLPSSAAVDQREGMSFMAELKRSYDIAVIPYFKPEIPPGLNALIIVDASVLRREMLYAIDQFVMNGGSLVVMVDPYVRFNRGSNVLNPSPSEEINDISDLLAKWGARYVSDAVVGDLRAASPVADSQETRLNFPFWMRIRKAGLGQAHPVSASLHEVFMVDPGSLEITSPDRVEALVSTSPESGTQPRNGYGRRQPRELAASFAPDGKVRNIALAIRAPFDSAFAAAPSPADTATPSPKHLAHSSGQPTVFVVADVDWIFDPFALQRVDLGSRTVVRPLNDNLTFLLNLVEYAAGESNLVRIRSRGRLHRPFTTVQQLFEVAQTRYRQEEAALSKSVSELEARMQSTLRSAGDVAPNVMPESVRRDVENFRGELVQARKRLRDVRHLIRTEVESLGRRLTAINLFAGPVLVVLLWLCVMAVRRRGQRAT
jgi:ABC-2 type transport system permease protein